MVAFFIAVFFFSLAGPVILSAEDVDIPQIKKLCSRIRFHQQHTQYHGSGFSA